MKPELRRPSTRPTWRSFWMLFLLVGGLAVGATVGCGPQMNLCPGGPNFECVPPANEGGAGSGGGSSGNPCDGAAQVICNGVVQCPPCP
jgi:hypothetical protein